MNSQLTWDLRHVTLVQLLRVVRYKWALFGAQSSPGIAEMTFRQFLMELQNTASDQAFHELTSWDTVWDTRRDTGTRAVNSTGL